MGKAEAVRPLLTALAAVADGLAAAVLSPPCAVCRQVVSRAGAGALCDGCWDQLAHEATGGVSSNLPSDVDDRAASLGSYEGALRLAIHALKYDARRSIAPHLARLLAQRCGAVLEGADGVVPVPLHPIRRWSRGFNQAEEIARGLGVPMWRVLRRTRRTPPQASLTATAREANVRGAFAPRRWSRAAGRVAGRCVVLLDDVTTTGATLGACAAVLRGMGAADVRSLAVARTPRSAAHRAV